MVIFLQDMRITLWCLEKLQTKYINQNLKNVFRIANDAQDVQDAQGHFHSGFNMDINSS